MLGVWIAGNLVDLTEKKGMKVYYEPQVRRLAAFVFPARITIGDKVWDLPQGTQKLDETSRRNLDADLAAHPLDQADYDFWHYHDFMGAIGNILVGPYGLDTDSHLSTRSTHASGSRLLPWAGTFRRLWIPP